MVRPNISLHFVQHAPDGLVTNVMTSEQADAWVNGGFFALRRGDLRLYFVPGDEVVEAPFQRLVAARKLAALPIHWLLEVL